MTDAEDNPLLIPPPPAWTKKQKDDESAVAEAASDTSAPEFIALPPGVVDSGTRQLPTPRSPRERRPPAEAITFFPAPIGAPVPQSEASVESPTWRLVVPGAADPVPVIDELFIGRNPARTADRPAAGVLSVVDPAKSVSKTHALLEVDDAVLYVWDLGSTNGVFVSAPGGGEVRVTVGERAVVPTGSTLDLGDLQIGVQRS